MQGNSKAKMCQKMEKEKKNKYCRCCGGVNKKTRGTTCYLFFVVPKAWSLSLTEQSERGGKRER